MSNTQPRNPITHDLKCWPEPFQAVKDGLKPFEWRRDDRDYQVGDTLHLQEWMPDNGYTGREITITVTYILHGPDYGIPEGYCIMGIVPVQEHDGVPPEEAKVLGAMFQSEGSIREEHLIAFIGNLGINRWLKAGLVEWQERSPLNFTGVYVLTDKGRVAGQEPQERRPERA